MKIDFNRNLLIIPLIYVFSTISIQMGFAEGRVNFVLGNVWLKLNGKKKLVKRGMQIPENVLLITGKNGRVSIYNYKTKKLITIKPNIGFNLF